MIDRIENTLKHLLQQDISVLIKNKVVKHGKLVIFRHVGCFIRLELMNGTKPEHIEMPIPYAIESSQTEPHIYFDYRLITLADGDLDTLKLLQKQAQVRDSKYYDRILTIVINHGN